MSSTPWGVDLSPTYNPVVDAAAIKAAGASYAILKVSEGVGWPDELARPTEFAWFGRVAADVVEAGLELRVYHLATPKDRADALAEAAWFDRHLLDQGSAEVDLPISIAYDLEAIPPGMSPLECLDIFDAWQSCIRGFLPAVIPPIELYCNRTVFGALRPFLSPGADVWLAWPGWDSGIALSSTTMRVQVGQRTFPGTTGNVDVNVAPAATPADIAEALGHAAPPPIPAPQFPSPSTNSDWSLAVHTIDLRNANTTPVRGPSVKALQTLMNLLAGSYSIAVDGIAGPATRDKLGLCQSALHLTVDYIAGPATWAALVAQ